VHQNRSRTTPAPTIVWIHGGNWVGGSKAASLLSLLPFFEMGWNVVTVDYRLVTVAPAPAAVEDCHCALRWVAEHAAAYNIDPTRVVVAGNSAGGQLALTAAMAPLSAGFDGLCPGPQDLKAAAVINWYGFANLLDLLEGSHANAAVDAWIGK
jgi:acetyl esterase/lipase